MRMCLWMKKAPFSRSQENITSSLLYAGTLQRACQISGSFPQPAGAATQTSFIRCPGCLFKPGTRRCHCSWNHSRKLHSPKFSLHRVAKINVWWTDCTPGIILNVVKCADSLKWSIKKIKSCISDGIQLNVMYFLENKWHEKCTERLGRLTIGKTMVKIVREVMCIQDPRESVLLKHLYYLPPLCYRTLFPKFSAVLFGT